MPLNYAIRVVLVLGSYVPLMLVFAVQYWGEAIAGFLLLVALSLVLFCFVVLRHLGHVRKRDFIEVKNVEDQRAQLLGYFLSNLFPFFLPTSEWAAKGVAFALAIVMCVLYAAKIHYYFINPVLQVLGYSFYQVETAAGVRCVILSGGELRSGQSVQVVALNRPWLFLAIAED